MPYPISPLELAKRIVGPRKELPPGSKHSLSHLQDIRWGQLNYQEQQAALATANMVMEFFEETLALGRQPRCFTLRDISFTKRARHKGRSGNYGVISEKAKLQTAQPIFDNEDLTLYRDSLGNWYARPTHEFEDGRFEVQQREGIPDAIGENPLQMSRDRDGATAGSIDRLRFIVDWQQIGVPDELMLCWRVDVSRVLMLLAHLQAARDSLRSGLQVAREALEQAADLKVVVEQQAEEIARLKAELTVPEHGANAEFRQLDPRPLPAGTTMDMPGSQWPAED